LAAARALTAAAAARRSAISLRAVSRAVWRGAELGAGVGERPGSAGEVSLGSLGAGGGRCGGGLGGPDRVVKLVDPVPNLDELVGEAADLLTGDLLAGSVGGGGEQGRQRGSRSLAVPSAAAALGLGLVAGGCQLGLSGGLVDPGVGCLSPGGVQVVAGLLELATGGGQVGVGAGGRRGVGAGLGELGAGGGGQGPSPPGR
jgi:hypothetical protein